MADARLGATLKRGIVSWSIVIGLLLWLSCGLFPPTARAGSLEWTCPVCKNTFQFDPRDPSYRDSFIQRHMATVHGSSGQGVSYPGGYGGGDPSLYLMQQFFQGFGAELGRQMETMLNPQGPDNAPQRQMEAERERQLEEERLKLQGEQRQREWEETKAKLLRDLRGPKTGTLQPRAIDGRPELEVREVDDVFGTKTLKPRDVAATAATATSGSSASAWKSANCAAFLLKKANQAAFDNRFQEAAFLSNEAADLMSGARKSPQVECPGGDGAPSFAAGPTAQSLAEEERMKKQAIFYSRLYSRAAQQLGEYRDLLGSVKQKDEKLEDAKAHLEEARAKKDELEALKQQQSTSVSENAMAEALAALREAEAARDACEKDLRQSLEVKAKLEKGMTETRTMFTRAKEQPEEIDDLMGRVNVKKGGDD
ncbi:MAG TPA: hypothetical protein VMU60_13130 [Syntrophobacteria bacterium]|nr:hypothetical protein [Syntrophobacteria bacterium]